MSKSIALIASVISLSFAGLASAQYYKSGANYGNPDSTTTAVYKRKGPCSDPWVTIALINVYGTADASKCNVKLYNNGQWNDFNQLVHAVAKQKNSGTGSSLVAGARPAPPKLLPPAAGTGPTGAPLVNAGGMNAIAKTPAGVIGHNGATLVDKNGNRLVGNDGASAVNKNPAGLIGNDSAGFRK